MNTKIIGSGAWCVVEPIDAKLNRKAQMTKLTKLPNAKAC